MFFSNAVTGTKQLKLGLDKIYRFLTKELLPEIRGISFSLWFEFHSWSLDFRNSINKGEAVVNGYESITGQINTEFVKFNKKPENSVNLLLILTEDTEATLFLHLN